MVVESITLGIVPYLNVLPLVEGWDPRWGRLRLAPPSALVPMLLSGEIDVGLLPSAAYALHPELAALDAGAIACRGAVASVRLFCRVPLAEVRSVAADSDSLTSVTLLRLLLAGPLGLSAEVRAWDRRSPAPAGADAVLWIGDEGLQDREPGSVEVLDLGRAWHDWTGLPFVFAFWMALKGPVPPEATARLRESAARGLAEVPAIARREAPRRGLGEPVCLDYLTRRIVYEFGPRERQGLGRFLEEAARAGLLPQARPLEFA